MGQFPASGIEINREFPVYQGDFVQTTFPLSLNDLLVQMDLFV